MAVYNQAFGNKQSNLFVYNFHLDKSVVRYTHLVFLIHLDLASEPKYALTHSALSHCNGYQGISFVHKLPLQIHLDSYSALILCHNFLDWSTLYLLHELCHLLKHGRSMHANQLDMYEGSNLLLYIQCCIHTHHMDIYMSHVLNTYLDMV